MSIRLGHPDVIHGACPKDHLFRYVTSKGFGWCLAYMRYYPATLEAEHGGPPQEEGEV